MNFFKKFFRYFLVPVFMLALLWVLYFKVYGNFHKVDDDFYRSAQLYSFNLPYYINKYGIKTILNLRGKSDETWYIDEVKISKDLNVTHIDYGIPDRKKIPIKKMQDIVEIIKNAKKPLLVHCKAGADRTSLVSALYLYDIKKDKDAKDAISILYGHFPYFGSKTIAMDESFKDYIDSKKLK